MLELKLLRFADIAESAAVGRGSRCARRAFSLCCFIFRNLGSL